MSQIEYDVDQEGEDKDKEEFVAVEDDPNAGQDVGGDEGEKEGEDDEEGEDKEESRLGAGREEGDEDKKTRRREENKTRRARQREARDRTDREMTFLRKRNEDLERRFSQFEQETDARVTGSELATVETSISKTKSDLQLANQVIQQAVEQNNGANLAEALDHRDTIRDSLRDLNEAKTYLSQDRRSGGEETQQPLDPRHVAHAQKFMTDHDWWDPMGRDRESQAVLTIDRSLVGEGYDPSNRDYWDELRERVQVELPHHFESEEGAGEGDGGAGDTGNGKTQQDRKNQGPKFRTGGRERPLKKNEVYISPERKEALVEAGVWDDKVLRNKYLKAYANYDKEEAGSTGA